MPQFPRGLGRDGAREIPCWNAPTAGNEERHLPKEERNGSTRIKIPAAEEKREKQEEVSRQIS